MQYTHLVRSKFCYQINIGIDSNQSPLRMVGNHFFVITALRRQTDILHFLLRTDTAVCRYFFNKLYTWQRSTFFNNPNHKNAPFLVSMY